MRKPHPITCTSLPSDWPTHQLWTHDHESSTSKSYASESSINAHQTSFRALIYAPGPPPPTSNLQAFPAVPAPPDQRPVLYPSEVSQISISPHRPAPSYSYHNTTTTMAIYPKLYPPPQSYPRVTDPTNIEAWTEQAAEALQGLSLSTSAQQATTPRATASVALAIPLDSHGTAQGEPAGADTIPATAGPPSAYRPRREPLHRDSLKRREALLKGKEGSRRRQRWENGTSCPTPFTYPPSHPIPLYALIGPGD